MPNSVSEVMTTAIIVVLFFKGNFSLASRYIFEQRWNPKMLSSSHFNRRIYRIAELFFDFLPLFGRNMEETEQKISLRDLRVITIA